MKNIVRLIPFLALMLSASVACEENTPVVKPAEGTTVVLASGQDASSEINAEFEGPWKVSAEYNWFTVSPASGEAGPAVLTVTATAANTEARERTAAFKTNDGVTETTYYVVQEGAPAIEADTLKYVAAEGDTVTVSFGTNLDVTAESDAEWLTVDDDILYGEPETLEDGRTVSKYRTASLTFVVEENEGGRRSAHITLAGGDDVKVTIRVEQVAAGEALPEPDPDPDPDPQPPVSGDVDFSKDFLRRSLVMKFTGTWCPNCPAMSTAIDYALEDDPEHIVAMSLYNEQGASNGFQFPDVNYFVSLFSVPSYPDGAINYYGKIGNAGGQINTATAIVLVAREAVSSLPSNTAIAGSASVSGGKVDVNLDIYSKDAGNYTLNVFLVENGIVAYQAGSGGGDNYEHNHVARQALTGTAGEKLSLGAESVHKFSKSFALPSSVIDEANLEIVAYLTYQGSFQTSVARVTDVNTGLIVDNVTAIPVNGTEVPVSYEE
ncbi:MAG TPA: Omp28-related outer membrane protein [Candidatus Coprenecus stercoravium]|uniref:Omp28-related outer membrane protein n=1 Tax=Candidatus Coprenecus stercoravium TaxID=2840735 RepID=A0A9D2GP22_9BACT|nr:Omp28-related outer membrane protein [Candidatus Coprenecus stercoravium]